MKILSGQFCGRIIHRQAGPNLRPTTDKVRQSIFNTLRDVVPGKRALDLFSGTGALGFEAISLGAEQVLWVEADRAQARGIERTLKDLVVESPHRVMHADVFKVLPVIARQRDYFDLFFLDPPYKSGLGEKAMAMISQTSLFHEESILVLETHKTERPPEEFGRLRCIQRKRHGDTQVIFYKCL